MTLRELIAHRQTTGAALGRALGWSRATVSDYVTGKRRAKLDTALRIAAALDAVVVMPRKPGGPFGYAPEPEDTTQDEINEQYSYLPDYEPGEEE